MSNANNKYCPECKKWLNKSKFALEGANRLNRDGERVRRRVCGSCVWIRRKMKALVKKQETEGKRENLITALVELSRYNIDELNQIEEEYFVSTTNGASYIKGFDFADLKEGALEELKKRGYHRTPIESYEEGTFLIVGDSHGHHTKKEMFDLLEVVNAELNVDKILHVGHFLDDRNFVNPNWDRFDNLTVLFKMEESRHIESVLGNSDRNLFDVVKDSVKLGDLVVCNQDLIGDYVKTYIGNLDQEVFPDSAIVNCHRHEMDMRTTYGDEIIIASPGCLCENHIVRTVKQIDFSDGRQVKASYPDGYVKYRRMQKMYEFWQQGAIIVHVVKGEKPSVIPCRIKKVGEEYAMSYFDKIYTNSGVYEPERKTIINGDIHIPNCDGAVLSVTENIAADYKADTYVNLGDVNNSSALNHHIMNKGNSVGDEDVLREISIVHYILKKLSDLAPDCRLVQGNHERFYRDFVEKYPQLKNLVDFVFLAGVEKLGYKHEDVHGVIDVDGMIYFHGDMIMYGQKGNRSEKASKNFGSQCMMGHIHYPSIRFGCYSIGMSGSLDQKYNEINASRWTHGIGLCNHYKGENFATTIPISNYHLFINGKSYLPSESISEWQDFPEFKAVLDFEFEES